MIHIEIIYNFCDELFEGLLNLHKKYQFSVEHLYEPELKSQKQGKDIDEESVILSQPHINKDNNNIGIANKVYQKVNMVKWQNEWVSGDYNELNLDILLESACVPPHAINTSSINIK